MAWPLCRGEKKAKNNICFLFALMPCCIRGFQQVRDVLPFDPGDMLSGTC
jgi:hypothetical protein